MYDSTVNIECSRCKEEISINFNMRDFHEYQNGVLIQNAFPYLTPGEREMFQTRICDKCFKEIFKEEE